MVFVQILKNIANNPNDLSIYKNIYARLYMLKSRRPRIFSNYDKNLEAILIHFFKVDYNIDGFLRSLIKPLLLLKYKSKFDEPIDINQLKTDQFLIYFLINLLNTSLELEGYFKKIRYTLLVSLQEDDFFCEETLQLSLSIANQSFINEFIWNIEDEEAEIIKALRVKINSNTNLQNLAVYAMYAPLNHLKMDIKPIIPKKYLTAFETLYFNYFEEEKLKSTIPSLGIIDNEISVKVRNQYEENPYPRWIHLKNKRPAVQKILQNKMPGFTFPFEVNENDIEVLIAGCGTGQQPLSLAINNPGYKITAIDLSKASIAYAQRMASKLDIQNIEFFHVDILNLHLLKKQFHHVECSGVIHHMKDQDKAWNCLQQVLMKGSTMLISVYSKIARINITKIRAAIAQERVGKDNASVKAYRQKMVENHENRNDMMFSKGSDFYSTSMLRDLLFHEHEYQYTATEIIHYLEKYGLQFLGFTFFPYLMKKYRTMFPDDMNMVSLQNWNAFEKELENTYSMHNLWVQKK